MNGHVNCAANLLEQPMLLKNTVLENVKVELAISREKNSWSRPQK